MDENFTERARELGTEAVAHFTCLSEAEITYYEENLDQLPGAIKRGFIIPDKKPEFDFAVEVDRSIKPIYPGFVKKVIHPELKLVGPSKYHLLTDVEKWHDQKQETGTVAVYEIYATIKNEGFLKDCFSLADLLAIQEKGNEVFLAAFLGGQGFFTSIFAWKSVVEDVFGRRKVPYFIVNNHGQVPGVLDWACFSHKFNFENISPRFRN